MVHEFTLLSPNRGRACSVLGSGFIDIRKKAGKGDTEGETGKSRIASMMAGFSGFSGFSHMQRAHTAHIHETSNH